MGTFPLYDRPVFYYRISLGGTKYSVQFRHNYRDSTWYLDIFDRDRVALILGNIRLVYGTDLLSPFQHIIEGPLIVREPADSDGVAPGRDSFKPDFPNSAAIVFDDPIS